MPSLTSQSAKELSRLGASKGGRARANVLTAERRREIGRIAIAARWARAGKDLEPISGPVNKSGKRPNIQAKPVADEGIPSALYQGKLSMDGTDCSVYVLDNGKRVVAQCDVNRVLTGGVEGELYRHLQNLGAYVNSDEIVHRTVQFKIPGNQSNGTGYEATLLLDICEAWLRAREVGMLTSEQTALAKQAEIITRACAKVGIVALIDEATGFESFRKRQELRLKLQACIAEDLQEWALLFPQEFWFELARLESIRYFPRSRPLRWGKYIMAFVYDAVDGELGKELYKRNPDPHFKLDRQWLKELGKQRVHDQIGRVITAMKLCNNMDDFRQKFAGVLGRIVISDRPQFS
jgi:P63C domain